MLVLQRKKEQTIVIGDEIEVRVLSINGKKIRLGIEAPKEIKVRRGELPTMQAAGTDGDE